jgi:SRSO17 transposase
VLDQQAWALLRRLTRWLDQFKTCFGHRAQHVSLRQYVQGLLSDSPRKSMQAMFARVVEPTTYQALQHFLTHAPWNARVVWRRLLDMLPERRGVLILDETSFPKQGRHSVAVARQYCGALGKIANCQVAVTAALWTGLRSWPVGAELYLPESWANDPDRRRAAHIPVSVEFQEKWRLGLTLVRRARAAGLQMTGVVGDAEYGEPSAFRRAIDRMGLPYALGIRNTLTVFVGRPRVIEPPPAPRGGRPRTRLYLAPTEHPIAVGRLAETLPARRWRPVRWRNGLNPWLRGEFVALRVTPAVHWRRAQRLETVWLLCERPIGGTSATKFYFSNLPAHASLGQLVRLAHTRWAIEQHYQDFKTELGLDHFEGRSYPGWHHHMVISAVAYSFLQSERYRRGSAEPLTFPVMRAIVQEVFTGLLFAARPTYVKWINQAQRHFPLRM